MLSLHRFVSLSKLIIAASVAVALQGCNDSSKPKSDNGYYFRMKVGLTYKGQPVEIDFVAGCGVHYGHDVSGGSIQEPVSMTAFVFGAKMPEGHAVVIRTVPINGNFQPCYGDTTSNGHIPKDWLPFIVWYEHDDDFAHGIGYSTQDAYENPNAKFGFRSVSVERATKAEFDAFMREGPHNLLPSYLTDWLSHLDAPELRSVSDVSDDLKRTPTKAWIYSGRPFCRGVQKIDLTPSQRAQVRDMEPAAQTGYWTPLGWQAQLQAFKIINENQRDGKLHIFRVPYTDADRMKQPKIYPIDAADSLARLNVRTAEDGNYVHDILLGDGKANLGFVYCDARAPFDLERVITGRLSLQHHDRTSCRIADYSIPIDAPTCNYGGWTVFWQNDFAITSIHNETN